MHKILKFFRFPAQSRSTLSTHAAHLPSGVLSPPKCGGWWPIWWIDRPHTKGSPWPTPAPITSPAPNSLRDAEASTLVNVRERHLHSAAAWQAMAARAAKVEASRIAREDGIAIPPL
jgi:hypothetical protein